MGVIGDHDQALSAAAFLGLSINQILTGCNMVLVKSTSEIVERYFL